MSHESSISLRRNQWMNERGREYYSEWMDRLLDAANNLTPQFDLDAVRRQSPGQIPDRSGEILAFASAMSSMYFEAEEYLIANDDEPLLDKADELAQYTSVHLLSPKPQGNPDFKVGVRTHNKDSLDFAVATTLGFARVAEKQLDQSGQKSISSALYRDFAARLRNPSFHHTLETLAFTGFGIHGQSLSSQILYKDKGERYLRYQHQLPLGHPLLRIDVSSDGSEDISLDPTLRLRLHEALAKQNHDGVEGYHGPAWATTPVSSGCPVRRPAEGAAKSAIAQFSDALAYRVETHMVSRQATRELGRTAAAYSNCS